MALYRVIMTYPGGRVEEVEDTFSTLEDAKDYGRQLTLQAQANTNYRDKGDFFVKETNPYFIVTRKEGAESSIVFDSRQ